MRVLLCTLVSVGLHFFMGWPFTVAAGILAGFMIQPRGWLWGGIAVGLGWLGLAGYNFYAAPDATREFLGVMGTLMGNQSPIVVVALTAVIGVVLGEVGGMFGRSLFYLSQPGKTTR